MEIYKSEKIGDMVSKTGEKFSIFAGLDKKLVEDVKKKSLDESDEELQKNTGDRKRFGEGSYEEWYAKGRTPFALVHDSTGALAALVWFGPKPAHQGCTCHAAAWRSYAPFRGTGIMKKFTQFVMDFYINKHPNTNLWAAIKKGNEGSLGLAASLGFEVDSKLSNEQSIILAKKVVPYKHE